MGVPMDFFCIYNNIKDANAMLDKLYEEENGSHPLERDMVNTFKIIKR